LQIVSSGGIPYVETGGALGASAQLWKMAASGPGFTFQSVGTGNYVSYLGNPLVADQSASDAAVFNQENCNGAGDPGQNNRFGFSSLSGTNPYWQANGGSDPYNVKTLSGGNATACAPANGGAWEGFFLNPGTDTLTVHDSSSPVKVAKVTVSVENPISFAPASPTVAPSTALPSQWVFGGSGTYSSCAVTTHPSGGTTCSVAAYGVVSYTPGSSTGTDTLTLTDSQGHTGVLTVRVANPATNPVGVQIGPSVSNPPGSVAPMGTASLSVTNESGTFTWTILTNNSGGSINSSTGVYTAGGTGNVSDVVQVTDQNGHTATVVLVVGPPVSISPANAAVQPHGTKTFTASGGSGTSYTWSLLTNASGGSIVAGTGAYTAGATSGTDAVKVVDSLGNQATVSVTVSCGADGNLAILYPYNNTVFPLAMLPPVVQWSDNGTASYAKVTLQYPATGTPTFVYSEVVQENGPLAAPYNTLPTTLPVTGGGRAQIPSLVWTTFQNAAAGASALISVQTLENGQGTLASTVTIKFATAPLKGTIYYNSYDTTLGGGICPSGAPCASVGSACSDGSGSCGAQGATLSISVGNPTPTVINATPSCQVCHSLSATGNTMITQEQVYGGDGYISSVDVTLPSATETVIPTPVTDRNGQPGAAPGSPYNNDGRFSTAGISPDGTMMFTNAGGYPASMLGEGNTATPSGLYSLPSGTALTTSGIPSGLQGMFPAFATDTSAVAFNYNSYDGASLAMMTLSQSGGTWTFGAPQILYTPPANPAGATFPQLVAWPSFMPTVTGEQNGIVFENQIKFNCLEAGDDGSAYRFAHDVRHNSGTQSQLWWVNTTGTPIPARLDQANGVGYIPAGPNGHGLAGTTIPATTTYPCGQTASLVTCATSADCSAYPHASCVSSYCVCQDTAGGMPPSAQYQQAWGGASSTPACQNDVFNAQGNGDDTKLNFKPTVNPQDTGGYRWMVFTSRRMYGNVATVNPYGSDQGTTDEVNATAAASYGEAFQPSPRKLWVAAIKTNPTPGTDPSYPAFFLDGQELFAGNFHGYWVLPQCTPPSTTPSSANQCTSTLDCCQTTASTCTLDIPIVTNPPTSHCVPSSSISCVATGATCNTDTDCCAYATSNARCSAGTCQLPITTGYISQTVTYDYQASCATSGTAPAWEFLESDQNVPSGTTIGFAVQSAATEAALLTAPSASEGTVSTTVSPPQFSTSSTTVDQALRALSPPAASAAWLRVTVSLNASSDHSQTPTLTALTPTFDCPPSE
jgi:hypothetical protein